MVPDTCAFPIVSSQFSHKDRRLVWTEAPLGHAAQLGIPELHLFTLAPSVGQRRQRAGGNSIVKNRLKSRFSTIL